LQAVRKAVGLPLRVVRLAVPLAGIQQRLGNDVTSGRRDDLWQAAASFTAAEGVGIEDMVVSNDRLIEAVAREVMTFLGWL
jgi:hypothetical protein